MSTLPRNPAPPAGGAKPSIRDDDPMGMAGPELSDSEFRAIAKLVTDQTGIQLPKGKEGLVRSRLGKRLRATGSRTYREYLERVASGKDPAELTHLLDAISTNKTSWWREASHFDLLADWASQHSDPRRPFTVWSAGCSSGEEPYTMGIVLAETLGGLDRVRILATDLSTKVLDKAKRGHYPADDLASITASRRKRWFAPDATGGTVVPELRRVVSFGRLNLMGTWPMQGPFDAIFCRNVMIYFDKPTQGTLVERFRQLLRPGGLFCIGHSESLTGVTHQYQYVAPAAYRK